MYGLIEHLLSLGRSLLQREVLSPDADCSGLEYYIQLGTKKGSRSEHISRLIEHALRTHLDMINSGYGYEAFSVSMYGRSVHGLLFQYFGPHSPSYAEERVDQVLEEFGNAHREAEERKLAPGTTSVAVQCFNAREVGSEKGKFSQ